MFYEYLPPLTNNKESMFSKHAVFVVSENEGISIIHRFSDGELWEIAQIFGGGN